MVPFVPKELPPNDVFLLINLFTALSFAGFGGACFLSLRMKGEFARYRLPGSRVLTGWLQCLGAIGLLVGHSIPLIGFLASSGLCLLMLLGSLVRRRIGDSWLQTVPALFYMVLSFYLAQAYWAGGVLASPSM